MKKNMMKAMVLNGHGGIDKLEYRDVQIPSPKKGEVLVLVTATAKNNTDRKAREGLYPVDDNNKDEVVSFNMSGDNRFTFPRIQGADVAGKIVEVGEDVEESRIGQRGLLDFNIYFGDNENLNLTPDYYGHGADGGYAEYIAVPSDNFYHIPNKELSDAELSCLGMCSYQTGFRMLNAARVREGNKVLISGASGGVGTALIQMCRALGAIPYAVSSLDKGDGLLKLGAEKIIDRKDMKSLKDNILKATNGANIDAVMDLVGGNYTNVFIDTMIVDMKSRDDYPRLSIAGASAYNLTEILWSKIYLYQVEIHGVSHGTKAEVTYSIAYSGGFYALVYASDFGFRLTIDEEQTLNSTAHKIIEAIRSEQNYEHYSLGDVGPISFLHFMGKVEQKKAHFYTSRSATYVHPGVICRSTTGTGTSARLALLSYENKLEIGDKLETVSLRETKFIGTFDAVEKIQGYDVVKNRTTGKSYIIANSEIIVNLDDSMIDCSELSNIFE